MKFRNLIFIISIILFNNFCKPQDINTAGISGSIVYTNVATINNKIVRAIKVFNLDSKTEQVFPTDDFIFGGASVSKDGVIAQLFDRGRDQVVIQINKLNGAFVKSFVYDEPYSFANSGARISPDGSLVAFSLTVQLGAGKSESRVYFCGTGSDNRCFYYSNLGDPEWMPDGRLIAVNVFSNSERGGLYVTQKAIKAGNTTPTNVVRLGPENLNNASNPMVTSDGTTVILALGIKQNIYALNITNNEVKQITKDGLQQYDPYVSTDGKFLFYTQQCCPKNGNAVAAGPALHSISLNVNIANSTPLSEYYLTDKNGKTINPNSRYGYTTKTL